MFLQWQVCSLVSKLLWFLPRMLDSMLACTPAVMLPWVLLSSVIFIYLTSPYHAAELLICVPFHLMILYQVLILDDMLLHHYTCEEAVTLVTMSMMGDPWPGRLGFSLTKIQSILCQEILNLLPEDIAFCLLTFETKAILHHSATRRLHCPRSFFYFLRAIVPSVVSLTIRCSLDTPLWRFWQWHPTMRRCKSIWHIDGKNDKSVWTASDSLVLLWCCGLCMDLSLPQPVSHTLWHFGCPAVLTNNSSSGTSHWGFRWFSQPNSADYSGHYTSALLHWWIQNIMCLHWISQKLSPAVAWTGLTWCHGLVHSCCVVMCSWCNILFFFMLHIIVGHCFFWRSAVLETQGTWFPWLWKYWQTLPCK